MTMAVGLMTTGSVQNAIAHYRTQLITLETYPGLANPQRD